MIDDPNDGRRITLGGNSGRRIAPSIPQVAGVVIGNALEFYDFLIYAYYAVYIGQAFFPAHDATVSLLASLAAFGFGFLARPLGAFAFGLIGDRAGRKPAMILSFSLIGLADAGLALTPSYALIGVAAPVLLVLFRLLQGFAVGGEIGPSTAYLIEAAPESQRGVYASMQYASQALGAGLAAGVGIVLSEFLRGHEFATYGWRIALLLGVLIVPFGAILRSRLTESLELACDKSRNADDETQPRREFLRIVVLGFVMLSTCTVAGYVELYLTTYTIVTLHRPSIIGFGTAVVSNLATIVFSIVSGVVSDKIGRKPVMIVPSLLLCIVFIPAFWIMVHSRGTFALYAAVAALVGLSGLVGAAITTHVSESLPPERRAGAIGIIYALAVTIFGGCTQFVVAWLISATGNPLAPAILGEVSAAIGLLAMLFTRESAPARLGAA
jgi:MFS family permease